MDLWMDGRSEEQEEEWMRVADYGNWGGGKSGGYSDSSYSRVKGVRAKGVRQGEGEGEAFGWWWMSVG
jgi:hypothetical protein